MARKASTTEASKRGYHRARAALIVEMGGRCTNPLCCSVGDKARLEFDHPRGRTWQPRRKNRWSRIAQYRRDWLAGELRLLCRSCNGSLGARNIYMWDFHWGEPPADVVVDLDERCDQAEFGG